MAAVVIAAAWTEVLARKSVFRRMRAVGTMGQPPVVACEQCVSEHLSIGLSEHLGNGLSEHLGNACMPVRSNSNVVIGC